MHTKEKGKNRSEPGAAKKPPISTKLPPGVVIPGKKMRPAPKDEAILSERSRMEEGKRKPQVDMRREQLDGGDYREEYRNSPREEYRNNPREEYRNNPREEYRNNDRSESRYNYREEYRDRYKEDYQEDYRENRRESHRDNHRDNQRENHREQYRNEQAPREQILREQMPREQRPREQDQPAMVLKDSYFSAKLRKQEEERRQNRLPKPKESFGGLNDMMMEGLWKEMEKQISYDVPRGKELPKDFLESIGLSGEQVMISPKAVEALRGILGGKHHV